MMWLWIAGAVILACGAVLPPVLTRRRAGRRDFVASRDRARSVMSRLEWALDETAAGAGSGGGGVVDAGAGDGTGDGDAGGDGVGGDGGAVGGVSAADVAQARRCYTLAGSALAGRDTAEGFRQAEGWARQGLSALGVAADAAVEGSGPAAR